jgi:hypothetical protein
VFPEGRVSFASQNTSSRVSLGKLPSR